MKLFPFTFLINCYLFLRASKVLPVVKNSPTNVGDIRDTGLIPGSRRFPGGGHGNPLQYSWWKIPWAEEPGGLQSLLPQRAGHDWATEHTHLFVKNDFCILTLCKITLIYFTISHNLSVEQTIYWPHRRMFYIFPSIVYFSFFIVHIAESKILSQIL